jgi:DNA-binding HxlR family transcriptional regulator
LPEVENNKNWHFNKLKRKSNNCHACTIDEVGKLNELKQSGAITEEEYQKAKEALLS